MKVPSPQEVAERRRRGARLVPDGDGARRLYVLSSFNLDLLPPLLAEALDRRAVPVRIATGAFGQIAQQAYDPSSDLYAAEPTEIVIVSAVEDALAPLFDGAAQSGSVDPDELVRRGLDDLTGSVEAILEHLPAATCHVVTFGALRVPNEHVLDPLAAERGQMAVDRYVNGVRAIGQISKRVVIVDWEWHSRALGTAALTDERLWYLGRMRLNPSGLGALSDLVARHVAAQLGRARKVAAVDLDDTLWGGVIGEAGVAGLGLGEEGTGLAFRDFQRELLRLRESGVVLVVCSKNNREDVVEAFERHPGMVLRLDHFAAERINWQDKATNLREIADELSLGLSSFVFIDDNPVERDWIRGALPEVAVPDLPSEPAERPRFLRELGLFDRLELTEADAGRAAGYAAQGARSRLAGRMSFEDFLLSLEQAVTIEPVTEASIVRAAQLCQRTNQFNLTTRRHSVADLEAMLADEATELYTLALRDRFGDSGVTGVAILRLGGEEAELDTLLLSCRVLGRKVEDAFLAFLAGRASTRGARYLLGRYVPTERNAQVRTFLPDRGFEPIGKDVSRLDLEQVEIPVPSEIDLQVVTNA